MKPPKGYRAGTITVERWRDGAVVREDREGWIHQCGFLGLHEPLWKETSLWTITHLPTGRALANARTQTVARQCIGLLATVDDLASSPPMSSNTCSQVTTLLSDLQSQLVAASTATPRRNTGKKPGTALLSFSPVTISPPTPAGRVALNRAALALGEVFSGRRPPTDVYDLLERAATTQWREEIMVRVTQAPRAILLETDIPTHPPTTTPVGPGATPPEGTTPSSGVSLRDGTPATPAEFKRRYNLLLELGDRLLTGSGRFSAFYAEGEQEGWTVARLERWERLDDRFRRIVGEAWMIWSGAAFCLAVNPTLHRNVETRLGYVGNTERGWHELGIKTFLRHPEIAAVLPLRREMKERIWREL